MAINDFNHYDFAIHSHTYKQNILKLTTLVKLYLILKINHMIVPKTLIRDNLVFIFIFSFSVSLADEQTVRDEKHKFSNWSLSNEYYEEIEFINI